MSYKYLYDDETVGSINEKAQLKQLEIDQKKLESFDQYIVPILSYENFIDMNMEDHNG